MVAPDMSAISEVDRYWRKASLLIFGKDIGGISDYGSMLRRYVKTPEVAGSFLSKQKVYYSAPYAKGSRFASFAESGALPKASPVSLDDVKDIDSLAQAFSEVFTYSGSKMLGNSRFSDESDNIINSTYCLRCSTIFNCEYMAYCNYIRDSKYMFGCSTAGDSSYCINNSEFNGTTRSFECGLAFKSSDTYYSFYTRNCHNAFFCFNLSNKNYVVGNNEVGKERFASLKSRLLEQMAGELVAKKTLPSLVELVAHG